MIVLLALILSVAIAIATLVVARSSLGRDGLTGRGSPLSLLFPRGSFIDAHRPIAAEPSRCRSAADRTAVNP